MMQPETICLFRNGIGNLIMQTPCVQALASMDSTGKVDYCIDSEWNDSRMIGIDDILHNWPIVNKVYYYPRDQIRHRYKTWFHTPHTEYSQAYEYFKQQGKIMEMRVDWKNTMLHETEYYMSMARKLGYKGKTPDKYCPVADTPIIGNKIDTPRVGICNGYFHTQSWDKKAWPHFKELTNVLKNRYNAYIVKIGIEKELDEVKNADADYVGKLKFTETAKVISQLDLLITTDTSNMHVADALKVPCITLFGGTFVFKSGPLSKTSHVLTAPIKCRPCQSGEMFTLCKTYDCMMDISVGDVLAKIREKMMIDG